MLNKIFDLMYVMIIWAFLGFAVAFVLVMAITIAYESGNGPLALIYYGPLGFIIGGLIGLIKWIVKYRKTISVYKPHHILPQVPSTNYKT